MDFQIFKSHKMTKLSLAILTLLSSQIYAAPPVDVRATAPYIIKPNTSFTAPSGLSPSVVKSYYGFDKITNQGEGRTIAIVDAYDHPNAEQDLAVFSTMFNLPQCTTANGCFRKVYSGGTKPPGDTGWGVEIALDIQWAHAIAPKAKIILVETPNNSMDNLIKGAAFALQFNPDVVSMSWGALEYSYQVNYDSIFNVPGVEFTAASMDDGHSVWYPSSSPYVIGVGGTTLINNAGVYSEKAWSGSGGGISIYEKAPNFQTNFPIPNNPSKMRGVPDISYIADPNSGFSIYDTYGYSGWMVIGGTSAGAPQWAALIAIAKSQANSSLSGMLSTLYTAAKSNYSANFTDITTGSNGSCGTLCNAAPGYDYVTGIGTPKVPSLLAALTGQMTVSVTPSNVTLNQGQTQQFTANVTGNSNVSVSWSASGGSITNSGLYTAPMVAGNYIVTATSVANPSVSGKANVTVTSGPPTDSNLALNKPTIASSEEPSPIAHPAIYATDNDANNTRWCAVDGSNGNWLLVDLGAPSNLTGSKVKWENSYLWKYKIDISSDELQWTTVVDKSNNTTAAQTYDDSFTATGRYVRITSLVNTGSQWASAYDFKVFGTQNTPPATLTNLALNKPTTASSQQSNSYSPAMATDVDTMTTRWSAANGNNGQWIMVDLGSAVKIAKTRLKWQRYGAWKYKVELSTDGNNWTLVVDKTNNTAASQTYEDPFSGQARYVRVTATANPSGNWASLFDFEVLG